MSFLANQCSKSPERGHVRLSATETNISLFLSNWKKAIMMHKAKPFRVFHDSVSLNEQYKGI